MGYCDFGKITTFKDGTSLLEDTQYTEQVSSYDRIHIVGEGDLLPLLSVEYYGNADDWFMIAFANNLLNPYDLEVGQALIIPAI